MEISEASIPTVQSARRRSFMQGSTYSYYFMPVRGEITKSERGELKTRDLDQCFRECVEKQCVGFNVETGALIQYIDIKMKRDFPITKTTQLHVVARLPSPCLIAEAEYWILEDSYYSCSLIKEKEKRTKKKK
eukprot:TRINITY_DN2922_c0_g1_i1.p1 TRINITY_DN2922_c0_g1~~TRINITY_DN2922_c0_g1_i1.p1  ORF type:complete len:133 (+),score=13.20 TRINITY_DN2922_c0_g1_i1:695-1093(+)